jgi:hypothetical protein
MCNIQTCAIGDRNLILVVVALVCMEKFVVGVVVGGVGVDDP